MTTEASHFVTTGGNSKIDHVTRLAFSGLAVSCTVVPAVGNYDLIARY